MVNFVYKSCDFTDFNDAVKIDDKEVQKLIDDVTSKLFERSKEKDNFCIAGTGDTMVFGFMFDENNDGVGDNVHIYVARGYEYATCWNDKRAEKWEKMDWSILGQSEYERLLFEKELIEARLAQYDPHREV